MNKKLLCIVLLIFGIAALSFSQNDNPIGGYVQSNNLMPSGWNDEIDYLNLSSDLYLSVRFMTEYAELFGAVDFTIDDLTGSDDFTEKLGITPGEIYLSLFLGKADITLGHQILSWGTADGLNPTNNVNPKDLSDILASVTADPDDLVLPVDALRFNLYPADFLSFEGVFMPLFTAPGIPDFASYLPSELSSVAVNFTYPDTTVASFETGVKANFILPGIDFSLSYLYVWDDLPDLRVTTVQQDLGYGIMFGVPASLDFEFNRVHIIGADFAWPIWRFDFRGEAAFFLTDDINGDDIFVKNPYFHYVVGLGYTFFESLNCTLQFSQKIVTNFKKVSDYDYVLDPTDSESWNQEAAYYEEAYTTQFSPLTSQQKGAAMSSIMLIIRNNFLNNLMEASVAGIYNFPEDYDDDDTYVKYGDLMVRPALSYQFTDAFDVELGANLFFSMREEDGGIVRDPYTTFGMVDDKDSFFLNAKYSF